MEEELNSQLNYPELPEGYVWKKRGVQHRMDLKGNDVDIWHDYGTEEEAVVAWVREEDMGSGNYSLYAQNRNSESFKHGQATLVSSYQEGINLIHAQLMLGLIGKGKCLQE